ncbi:MAG TPA: hypothetical protein VM077_04555 [Candidatus Limnocylindrales bacterium]|nr:hypothetical protein [Candidatus Limnocylindrales bacterium]
MSAAQKIHASTQKFTEITDFVDNMVVLQGGAACLIIEITASNFALLSKREQDSRIFSYASLLNSLSFPIQILIRNKRIDISNYLKDLDEIIKNSKNPQLSSYISYYRDFVQEMVTVNVVLSKSFYIVIPFSSLEMGVSGAKATTQKSKKATTTALPEGAAKNLQSKAEQVLGQLQKFAVSARILERDDLIKLYYDIYNNGTNIEVEQLGSAVGASIVTGGDKK